MPTNLYGPRDIFDLATSHVVPAMPRKAHEAKIAAAPTMTIWGAGAPLREFMHVDDCADAIVHVAKTYSSKQIVNISSGEEVSIRMLVDLAAKTIGFAGAVGADSSKPDGTPRKLMDSSRLRAVGWRPRIGLEAGLADAYSWFLNHVAKTAKA